MDDLLALKIKHLKEMRQMSMVDAYIFSLENSHHYASLNLDEMAELIWKAGRAIYEEQNKDIFYPGGTIKCVILVEA